MGRATPSFLCFSKCVRAHSQMRRRASPPRFLRTRNFTAPPVSIIPPPPPPRPIPRPRVSPLPRAVQHTVSKFSAAAPPIRHKTSPHRAPPAPRGRTHDARSGAAGLPVHHARDTHHFATTPIGSTGDQAFSVAFLLRSPSYTTPPPLPFAGHKYPKVRRALSDAARSVHARCCLGAGATTAQANLNPI